MLAGGCIDLICQGMYFTCDSCCLHVDMYKRAGCGFALARLVGTDIRPMKYERYHFLAVALRFISNTPFRFPTVFFPFLTSSCIHKSMRDDSLVDFRTKSCSQY